MNKVFLSRSILVVGLIVGLIGTLAAASASDNATVTLTRGPSLLKLSIHENGSIDVSNFDPEKNYGPDQDQSIGTTTVKVVSTKNTDWNLSSSVNIADGDAPTGAVESTILNQFEVDLGTTSGSNGAHFSEADYIWSALGEDPAATAMPDGDYVLTVTYTVSPAS